MLNSSLPVVALVDSGAEISILSAKVAAQLRAPTKALCCPILPMAPNGRSLSQPITQCHLTWVEYFGAAVQLEMAAMEMPFEVILGAD